MGDKTPKGNLYIEKVVTHLKSHIWTLSKSNKSKNLQKFLN